MHSLLFAPEPVSSREESIIHKKRFEAVGFAVGKVFEVGPEAKFLRRGVGIDTDAVLCNLRAASRTRWVPV